jgi:carbonic anhydrase
MKFFAPRRFLAMVCVLMLCAFNLGSAQAAEEEAQGDSSSKVNLLKKPKIGEVMTSSAANPKEAGEQVREALGTKVPSNKKLTVIVSGKGSTNVAGAPINPQASREYAQARAAAMAAKGSAGMQEPAGAAAVGHTGEVHWAYDGENGPQSWGRLKPEFNLCAIGKRQSPINIQDGNTLAGPAEPVQFNYTPSNGTVVNNGHTIQVNVDGDNSITVRGSRYQLIQFHFHTPSEEQVNYKRFAMVAHLVHKNEEGQLAVVAVLLEQGESNALINKVWTYMPLDVGDSVRMPASLLDMNDILPKDQRYYQFMGSLTTPPCTEGVLWMVLKQPVQLSQAQYKLFTQLYPLNARPLQALNGRPVRDAQ